MKRCRQCDVMELDSSSLCFTTMSSPRGLAGTVLVDSGADDHIGHPGWAKESPLEKECDGDTERCARQSIISPWYTSRQSESWTYLTTYSVLGNYSGTGLDSAQSCTMPLKKITVTDLLFWTQ